MYVHTIVFFLYNVIAYLCSGQQMCTFTLVPYMYMHLSWYNIVLLFCTMYVHIFVFVQCMYVCAYLYVRTMYVDIFVFEECAYIPLQFCNVCAYPYVLLYVHAFGDLQKMYMPFFTMCVYSLVFVQCMSIAILFYFIRQESLMSMFCPW